MGKRDVVSLVLLIFIFQSLEAHTKNLNEPPRNPRGGYIVPRHRHPAILEIHTPYNRCSASLIGPKILVTAAHCKPEQTDEGFFYHRDRKFKFKFFAYSGYPEQLTKDVAFGVISEAVPHVQPFTISWENNDFKKVIAYGFGCSGLGLSTYFLNFIASDIYAKVYRGNRELMAVCDGDSGGPVFAFVKDKLSLVEVIIRRGINTPISEASILARPYVYELLIQLQADFNLEVCGINKECQEATSSVSVN